MSIANYARTESVNANPNFSIILQNGQAVTWEKLDYVANDSDIKKNICLSEFP